ncbi:MAG: cell cycle transcriptional regulator TrcR [Salaquimonas sp.]
MTELLMPKATAVWLVDNTSLSFNQIAEFCKLHPLEVKAIADGEAATGIKGLDPISTGQISRDELEACQKDPSRKIKLQESRIKLPSAKRKRPRYTPVSKRQDRPNAIRWLTRNHPELKDAQIIRLVGTTKNTIEAIRDSSHWNAANLTPMDPVTLGLCTQIALDLEVAKANKNRPVDEQTQVVVEDGSDQLIPASQTQDGDAASAPEADMDAASVFSKFSNLKSDDAEETEDKN